MFTRTAGGSYHPQTISQALARRSQGHGLPRLTAHGLRHTSATLMLASGVAPGATPPQGGASVLLAAAGAALLVVPSLAGG